MSNIWGMRRGCEYATHRDITRSEKRTGKDPGEKEAEVQMHMFQVIICIGVLSDILVDVRLIGLSRRRREQGPPPHLYTTQPIASPALLHFIFY